MTKTTGRALTVARLAVCPAILLGGAFATLRVSIPGDVADGTRTPGFSAERALRDVEAIARQPHPMGSQANQAVRDYLVGELQKLGLDTEVQRAEVLSRLSDGTVAATVENIVAVRKGKAPLGKALGLMSHYDSVVHAPGAADDASGVATILEALRATAQDPPAANDLVVVFTDGEESGMLGAQAFTDRHPLATRLGLVLNFEARGTAGPVLLFEAGPRGGALVQQLATAAPAPITDSLFELLYQAMPNDTDLSVTAGAGLPGMNFAFIEGSRHYHNTGDRPENLSIASLRHAGSYAVPLLRRFGNLPLPVQQPGDELGYFNLTGGTLVRYPLWLGSALLAAACAAFLGLVLGEARVRWSNVLDLGAGAAFALLVAVSTFVLVNVAHRPVTTWLGEAAVRGVLAPLILGYACVAVALYVALAAWVERGIGWKGGALATAGAAALPLAVGARLPVGVVAAAVIGALLLCVRRPRSLQSLRLGALGLWLAASALLAWSAPGALHVTLVPCLLLLFAAWLARRSPGAAGWRAVAPLAVPLAACVWWLAYYFGVLQQALGAQVPGAPLALLALLLVAAGSLLGAHASAKPALEPALYLLAGAGLVVAVTLVDGVDPARKRTNQLIYARDVDAGTSYWLSPAKPADAWTSRLLGEAPQERTVASFFPGRPGSYQAAVAPGGSVAAPDLQVSSDVTGPADRRVSLRLVPGSAGSEVNLFLENPKSVLAAALNGVPVALQNGRRGWWRWTYYAMPAQGVQLDLTLDKAAGFHARVTEAASRWPAEIAAAEPRPPGTLAKPGSYSDMTLITREFGARATP